MRSIYPLAAAAGFLFVPAQAQASWQAYYPPMYYHSGYAYPSSNPPVLLYSLPSAYGTASYGTPTYEHAGTAIYGHPWHHHWHGKHALPPGLTWHPWVRSPRDFFMMEQP